MKSLWWCIVGVWIATATFGGLVVAGPHIERPHWCLYLLLSHSGDDEEFLDVRIGDKEYATLDECRVDKKLLSPRLMTSPPGIDYDLVCNKEGPKEISTSWF